MNDSVFLSIAGIFASQSTCSRVHVGSIIVKDKRIISSGYNGVPKGFAHCNEIFTKEKIEELGNEVFLKEHKAFSDRYELHAEENAIAFAAKNGVSLDGSTIYTTTSPCHRCAKLITSSGISRVVFETLYDRENSRDFLESSGIVVDCLKET